MTNYWVGLFTKSGEVKAASYRREPCRLMEGAQDVLFSKATEPWGEITHFKIFRDPVSRQKPLAIGKLTPKVDIFPDTAPLITITLSADPV